MAVRLLGVYREQRFSPGRHAAGDAGILDLTRAALERHGYGVTLLQPEALSARPPEVCVVFAMCQGAGPLAVLAQWQRQGILVVNTPAAIRSCYRRALVTRLGKADLAFPRSVVVPLHGVDAAIDVWPPFSDAAEGCWVKRGDVHAMQADDVVFVRHAVDWQARVARFRQRGIRHAIVQEHIAGSEIKFYAVRGHGVLHYVAPYEPDPPPLDPDRLQALVRRVGELFHLDVYGGDCILTPDGKLVLVDVNDWPSFRGCRPQAAGYIARYLLAQAGRRGLL